MNAEQFEIMACISLLISAQVVGVILKAAGYKYYVLASIGTFILGAIGCALWGYWQAAYHQFPFSQVGS